MMTFEIVVFSKDRACQLHAFLESVLTHISNVVVSVVYTYSEEHKESYEKLIRRFSLDNVFFVKENDFRSDIISCVAYSKFDHIAFSTDDTIIYRPLPSFIPAIYKHECFSLRLGLNTIVQNPYTGELQMPLKNYNSDGNNVISWNCSLYHPFANYGYPMSLDLHIFQRQQILSLIKLFDWKNSNQLEGGLCAYRNEISYMRSFVYSVAVNVPLNNMSKVTQTNNSLTQAELLAKYMDGEVVDLSKIDAKSIKGCHQEIPLHFRKFI